MLVAQSLGPENHFNLLNFRSYLKLHGIDAKLTVTVMNIELEVHYINYQWLVLKHLKELLLDRMT